MSSTSMYDATAPEAVRLHHLVQSTIKFVDHEILKQDLPTAYELEGLWRLGPRDPDFGDVMASRGYIASRWAVADRFHMRLVNVGGVHRPLIGFRDDGLRVWRLMDPRSDFLEQLASGYGGTHDQCDTLLRTCGVILADHMPRRTA